MRVCRYTWPFPFGVRLGWASTRALNPTLDKAKGQVFLLRGNAIVFSRGLGILCGQLRRLGFWSEDLRCVGDLWVVRKLASDQKQGRLRGPIVFVGHSCGGRYSLYAAHELLALGITVELVVTLDVALPLDVPANVKRAVNLYRSRKRLYPARPLRAAPDSPAVVENIDLDAEDSPVKAWWLTHLTLTDSSAVRDLVLGRIPEAA